MFLIIPSCVAAQRAGLSLSAVFTGSCSYSGFHADVFSFVQNPAALPPIKSFSLGLSGERRYLLQELAGYNAVVVVPTSSGNFGLHGRYFGNHLYHEMLGGIAYGRRMGNIDAGIQGSFTQKSAAGYSGIRTLNAEGGIIFQLSEKVRMGIHMSDPVSLQTGKMKEGMVFSAGAGYDGSENFHVELIFRKEEDVPVNIMAAFHYGVGKKIFFRAGISCSAPLLFAGAGFYLRNMRFDLFSTYHPYLGITPGMTIVFSKQN